MLHFLQNRRNNRWITTVVDECRHPQIYQSFTWIKSQFLSFVCVCKGVTLKFTLKILFSEKQQNICRIVAPTFLQLHHLFCFLFVVTKNKKKKKHTNETTSS